MSVDDTDEQMERQAAATGASSWWPGGAGLPALPSRSLLHCSLSHCFAPAPLCDLACTGKTSLMVKYVEGNFNEDYIQTLGQWTRVIRCWLAAGCFVEWIRVGRGRASVSAVLVDGTFVDQCDAATLSCEAASTSQPLAVGRPLRRARSREACSGSSLRR